MPKFETWKLDRSYTLRPGTKTVPRPTLLKIWNIHEALMAKLELVLTAGARYVR